MKRRRSRRVRLGLGEGRRGRGRRRRGPEGGFAHGPIITLQMLDRRGFLAVELRGGDTGGVNSGGLGMKKDGIYRGFGNEAYRDGHGRGLLSKGDIQAV
jgi:hypothetical protein